jgi:hypothetical protein
MRPAWQNYGTSKYGVDEDRVSIRRSTGSRVAEKRSRPDLRMTSEPRPEPSIWSK